MGRGGRGRCGKKKKFEELMVMLMNLSVKYCKPLQKRQASVFYSVLFSFSGGNLHEMSVFLFFGKIKKNSLICCLLNLAVEK